MPSTISNVSNHIERVTEIIGSTVFKEGLEVSHRNFPNLKLEHHIRNILVIEYNKNRIDDEPRAFAEHPRHHNTLNGARTRNVIDFSLADKGEVLFTMEMKYQFPSDCSYFSKYENDLKKAFNGRYYNDKNVDAFLLIVCDVTQDIAALKAFENEWQLNSLSKYQLKKKPIDWGKNIITAFKKIESTKFVELPVVEVQGDFTAGFHFYLIYRSIQDVSI